MGTRKEQVKDIRLYSKFIRKCNKHQWIFSTPVRHIEKLFWRHHQTLKVGAYFDTVMSRIVVTPKHALTYYRDELMSDKLLEETYLRATDFNKDLKIEKTFGKVIKRENYVTNYYALIRERKPKIVVETGTADGCLTGWILSAMHKNNCGKLLSIDIPPQKGKLTMATSLSADNVGHLIPNAYHDRWEYHAGDAKELLPKLLIENVVDIFIHDSLHTRTHMLFEYNCARALMRPGTIIISHDILWNGAFFSFVASHNMKGFSSISGPNLGLTVNEFDPYEERIGLGVVKLANDATLSPRVKQ
ncbi:MAG: class I SAM-dependent methyltransferase [Planctomycetota bacterium]|jgi:predicted O-methyltransferase YrrM